MKYLQTKKNRGQIVITMVHIISLIGTVIIGTGFFWTSQYNQDKFITQNTASVSSVNDKLDLLLENFDLKYIPK